MTAQTQEPGTKVSRRRRGIEPYLRRLEEACALGAAPDAIRFNDAGSDAPLVPLDAWAIGRIQGYEREPKGPADLPELLKQCLAFLLKSATDIARLRKEAPRAGADFYSVQAELMLGSAVGMALLRETQKSVDDLVGLGRVDDARSLARFQNRLRGAVRELKRSIVESNRGRDDELVEQFTDQAAPAATPSVVGDLETAEETPVATRRAQEPAGKRPRAAGSGSRPLWRTTVLLVLVVSAICVWLALRAIPSLAGGKAKVVSLADFNTSAPILRLVAPPPSAYVVVDEPRWAAYDEGQQRRLIEAMGGVLAANGYWGMLVRTPDGTAVARWLDGQGSVLLHDTPALQRRGDAPAERFERFVAGVGMPRSGAASVTP